MKIAELKDLDVEEIRRQVLGAGQINTEIAQKKNRDRMVNELNSLQQRAELLTTEIDKIDAEKAYQIASAKLPVDKLSFDENGIKYKGIPFEQCSSSEQLRVSVAMGLAMNPKLKVLLIRDGSLLDEDNLALVAKMAEEADAQVWLERVGEGKEASVIIEDGMVKAQTE